MCVCVYVRESVRTIVNIRVKSNEEMHLHLVKLFMILVYLLWWMRFHFTKTCKISLFKTTNNMTKICLAAKLFHQIMCIWWLDWLCALWIRVVCCALAFMFWYLGTYAMTECRIFVCVCVCRIFVFSAIYTICFNIAREKFTKLVRQSQR